MANSILAHTTGPFTFLLCPICRGAYKHQLCFPGIFKPLTSIPAFHFTIFEHSSTSISANKIISSAHKCSHDSPTRNSLLITSVMSTSNHRKTVTNKPLVHAVAECSQFHCSADIRAFQILHVYEPEKNTNKVVNQTFNLTLLYTQQSKNNTGWQYTVNCDKYHQPAASCMRLARNRTRHIKENE